MNPDPQSILDSKLAYRRGLTARPIAEKLRLLDALRERELVLRRPKRELAGPKEHAPDRAPWMELAGCMAGESEEIRRMEAELAKEFGTVSQDEWR